MKNSKLKVFFDSGSLRSGHAVRGIGSYTRNLATELRKSKDVELVEDINESDIVHYPYFDLFFNTLKLMNKPIVVTIYDVIPLLYLKYYQPGIRGRLNFKRQKEKLKKVDAIITISETSKKDIVRFLDVDSSKVFVTYLAPAKQFRKLEIGNWKLEIQKRYGLPERFVLYVGDVNYNKNIPNLIKACERAKLNLVIVGKQAIKIEQNLVLRNLSGPRDWMRYVLNQPHPEHTHFARLAKYFAQNKKVKRLGFVPDEELVGIYNLATLYCQPSFYEGFGLPVLEAMSCGCPVVCAKTQSLVEIAEKSAVFVNSKDFGEMALTLSRVAVDKKLRSQLITSGLTHVDKFSWDKTAKKTIEIYHEVLSK